MHYRYWDWGTTPKRDDYQYALLQQILDKTQASHGPYRLTREIRSYSTARVRREINRGNVINVRVGPWRPIATKKDVAAEVNRSIDIPIARNLLGYRRLLIRSADYNKFNNLTSEEQLKKLVLGQGKGWEEIKFYRAAGYNVMDNGNLETMFSMLSVGRFDYIAMSVIEVKSVLDNTKHYAPRFTLAPKIFIYYPLPIVYHVSMDRKDLAERIEVGLKAAKKDGSWNALLHQYFDGEITLIKQKGAVFYTLENHLLPKGFKMEKPFFEHPNRGE